MSQLLQKPLDIKFNWFYKMVKHIQAFVGKLPAKCLSVFEYFVGLALKGLKEKKQNQMYSFFRFKD